MAAFFFSGACGLSYEMIWMRKLGLILGTTIYGVSAVLSAFMAGLALGSYLAGILADKLGNETRLVRLYGLLELIIGLYALLSLLLLDLLDQVYFSLASYDNSGSASSIALKFIVAVLVLLPPTTCMGATLPLLCKYLARRKEMLKEKLGRLYGINTVGAVTGTALTGLLLIYLWGMIGALLATAIVNVIIAAIILLSFSSQKSHGLMQEKADMPEIDPIDLGLDKSARRLALIAFILSGFASFYLEVIWTKGLHLVIGSTVYAITLMLVTFLLGIGLGSLVLARMRIDWALPRNNPMVVLGTINLMCGMAVLFSVLMLGRLPLLFIELYGLFAGSFGVILVIELLLCILIMLPATLLMGAAFPLVGMIYVDTESRTGKGVGIIYSLNTVAAIAGALFGAFVGIRLLGIRGSLLFISGIYALYGFFLMIKYSPKRGLRTVLTSLLLALLLAFFYIKVAPWDKMVMSSGAYVYADSLIEGFSPNSKVIFYHESPYSVVSILQRGDVRSLRINGKTDGSDGEDMVTQVLLAQLPLLFHPQPKSVFVLGLGTGVTCGSAFTHPIEQLTCAEIDPGVVEAARLFSHVNNRALDDSRMRLVVDDARTYLNATQTSYDVIISEPSNPWISGVSNLFTIEQYRLFDQRLNQGGYICQWVHLYYLSMRDLRCILRTFKEVFPHCYIFEGSVGDILLVGQKSDQPGGALPVLDLDRITERIKKHKIADDLKRIGMVDYEGIVNRLTLALADLDLSLASINSDDHPIIEYSSPHSIFRDTWIENRQYLAITPKHTLPAITSGDALKAATAYMNLGVKSMNAGDFSYAAKCLDKSLSITPTRDIYFNNGICRFNLGDLDRAKHNFKLDLKRNPLEIRSLINLGVIAVKQGDLMVAKNFFEEALKIDPFSSAANDYMDQLKEIMEPATNTPKSEN